MNVKLFVSQGRPSGKVLVFGPGDYFLGRGPECHIRFDTDWVSRQHCLLRVTPFQATLRDLGSRNGTLINGQLLTSEQLLCHGDVIGIGTVLFTVHLEAVPPTLAPGEHLPLDPSADIPLDSTALRPPLPRDGVDPPAD